MIPIKIKIKMAIKMLIKTNIMMVIKMILGKIELIIRVNERFKQYNWIINYLVPT